MAEKKIERYPFSPVPASGGSKFVCNIRGICKAQSAHCIQSTAVVNWHGFSAGNQSERILVLRQ